MTTDTQATKLEAAALAAAGDQPLLADQVVVLTGASGGIGRAIAGMLVAAGAKVAVTDLSEDRVDEIATDLDVFGRACDAADLTRSAPSTPPSRRTSGRSTASSTARDCGRRCRTTR